MRNKLKIWAAALSLTMLCTGCKSAPEPPQSIVVSSAATSMVSSSSSSSSAESSSSSSSSAASSSGSSSSTESSSGSSSSAESSSGSSSSAESSSSSSSSAESSSSYSSGTVSSSSYSSSTVSSSSSSSSTESSSSYSSSAVSSSSYSSSTVSSSSSSKSSQSNSNTTSDKSTSSSSEAPPPIEQADSVQKRIEQMSLREKVYQMFFVTPEQLGGVYPVTTPIDIADKPVGGILLMGANLETREQTRDMLSKTQESTALNGVGVFLAVDEESGIVARCADKLGTTAFDGMAVYGERNDYDEAFHIGQTIGGDIKSLGFNVDFAPVADVAISPTNELGDRVFSDDPEVCANMVSGVVGGLNSSGVAATLKHFPGLGAEDGNTHTETSITIDRTLSQLRKTEFVPFKSGIQAGADFVMVGHQKVSGFGDELPADLSPTAVTTVLRGELGFNGIAITDAQNMNTISGVYGSGEAAKMSIKAGIDMILSPNDFNEAANAVINAVKNGEITEERINESVTRILTVKSKMGLLS